MYKLFIYYYFFITSIVIFGDSSDDMQPYALIWLVVYGAVL